MSTPSQHLVLARRYRPARFDQMVGQTHVVRALSNALSTGRLHHAYLFTGTRGVGKTTVSRILAKSLNCLGLDGHGEITAEPCGQCAACVAIDQGRFLDYTELDAASNRGVDEVQSLLEQAVYKPVEGRFKVFMIDEVHMLTNTAFNAMLKTLEEPPEYLKFVLATTDPQKVPVTVLSRCLQFNLRPLAPDLIAQHLAQVLTSENLSFEPAALNWLARGARGSLRDALSLTDQAIAFGGGTVQETAVQHMLGAVGKAPIYALIDHIAKGDGRAIVEAVAQLRDNGFSASATLDEMALVLQNMAIWQATQGARHTAPGQDHGSTNADEQAIAQLAQQMPSDETQLLYSLCLHGRNELGLGPDEYATLNMVLLRTLAFRPSPSAMTSGPSSAASASSNAPSSAPAVGNITPNQGTVTKALPPAASPAAALPTAALAAEKAPMAASIGLATTTQALVWPSIVEAVLAQNPSLPPLVRELALNTQLLTQAHGSWQLRLENPSLAQAAYIEKLQEALQTLGHTCTLQVDIGPVQHTPAQARHIHQAAQEAKALALVEATPLVQCLIHQFEARVVPNSLQVQH
jgi:DNA polymerase-3 subunit gamma/tau